MQHVLLAATLFAVTPGLLSAQDADAKAPKTIDLIERLGDDSHKVRRDAEEALRAQGDAAVEALRQAAESHEDAEVKWRAKRLLRQAEGGDRPGLAPRLPGAGGDRAPAVGRFRLGPDQDVGARFDQLFEQLERDLGAQIPRAEFFGGDFFQDLEARLEELRRGQPMSLPGGLPGLGQGFSMRMDGNGVRVEVNETDADGKSEIKTYEAPDVQTFREQYPAIAEKYLGDGVGGMRVFSFGPGARANLRGLPPGGGGWLQVAPGIPTPAPADDSGDRLGVYVEAVPEAVRKFLDLPAGVGLRVQSVVEESIAARAGVTAGDILLEVAGRSVAASEDVRAALGAVESGADFEMSVNRRGEARTLRGQAAERKPVESAPGKDDGPGLRRRPIR